jgi:SAM-dependent methyltransferase
MEPKNNKNVWDKHYLEKRSRQTIPDENIVRFFHHYLRNHPDAPSPFIVEIGSGSGRNLGYLQQYTEYAFGLDFAINAIYGQKNVVCGLSHETPFSDNTFDIVIAWGVLHYLSDENVYKTIREAKRILKKGGTFAGTIRSDLDTHLQHVLSTGDLASGSARLYSKEEVPGLFSDFSEIKLGFIMRQNPGDDRIIAHHIFELLL